MKNLNSVPDMTATADYATDISATDISATDTNVSLADHLAQPTPSRVRANYLVDADANTPIASPEPPSVAPIDGDNLQNNLQNNLQSLQLNPLNPLNSQFHLQENGVEDWTKDSAENWTEEWTEEWDDRLPVSIRRQNSVAKILTLVGGTPTSPRHTFRPGMGDSGNGDGGSGEGDDAGGASGSECGWYLERLSAYQDGELESDEARLVAAHVEGCSRCTRIFAALQATDNLLEREWRKDTPLPSSSLSSLSSSLMSSSSSNSSSVRFHSAIDGIMAALPAQQSQTPAFPARRVHERTRWMRFATAFACALMLVFSLWMSYHIGYLQGQRSILSESATLRSQSSLLPIDTSRPSTIAPGFTLPTPNQNSRAPLPPPAPTRTNS